MIEKYQQYTQQDVIQRLILEINHHFQAANISQATHPDSRDIWLIATDILVEVLEKETNQSGKAVINQLAEKIQKEQYTDDFIAAVDMVGEVLGEDFYSLISDRVSQYFSTHSCGFI